MQDDVPSFEDFELGRNRQRVAKPPAPIAPLATKLSELNLETELLKQYNEALMLSSETMGAKDIPANQKAQVLNSLTTILSNIVKTQTDLFNSERVKKLEACLIRTLKEFPDLQASFFAAYEEALREE